MQQIIYNGITIICAVYLAFVYVAYLNITLDKSNKKRKPLWLCGIILAVIYYFSSWGVISAFKLLYMPFVYFILCNIFFNGTKKTMIVTSLFFYILNYGLQLALAMLMLMKEIPENIMDYVSVGIMILRCVLLTCIIILLKRYISKHVEVLDKIFSRIIGWMTLIWFVYMGVIAGITLYISGRSGFSMKEAMLGSIILCLLILLVMLAFLAFVKIEEYTGRIRMQEREMQKAIYSTDYYRKLEKVNDENRKYIHNIEHYMKAIAGLVNENNNREVINIIEEMEKQALYVTKEIFCTDKIVNGVVSEKNGEAKNKNIEFRVNIEPTADLTFLDDIDKIGILGNLLDNAMEAAGKCRDNKSVALDIYTSNNNHFIVLNIQNTSETAPLKKGTRFLSTKKNQENHGIGLEYVKNVVAKYQGFLNIKYEDGVYYVRVIIPKYKR